MSGLPSPAALRRVGVAAVAGAGFALLGLSFSNVAALDSTLSAATEKPVPPPSNVHQVSFEKRWDCPRPDARERSRDRSTSLQY